MATVLQAGLEVLRLNIQARIMAITGLDQSCVILDTQGTSEDDDTHFQAEQLVFVRFEGGSPTGSYESMGRYWATERVRVVCSCWNRTALDAQPGFEAGLTDTVLGNDPFAGKVQNAIYGWQPTDANNNWLVQQPLYPSSGIGAVRMKKKDWNWAHSIVCAMMVYACDLDITYI